MKFAEKMILCLFFMKKEGDTHSQNRPSKQKKNKKQTLPDRDSYMEIKELTPKKT